MPRPVRTKVASRTGPSKVQSKIQSENDNVTSPISKLRARKQAQEAATIGKDTNTTKKVSACTSAPKLRTRAGRKSTENQEVQDDVIVASVEDRIPASSIVEREAVSTRRSPRSSSKATRGAAKNPLNAALNEDANADREHTPPQDDDTTAEDLYGLSPGGEQSQARIQARLIARRQSMQAGQPSPGVKATPAMDRSTMALTNFKRRARQPSLLRMVTAPSDTGAQDEDDLEFTNIDDIDLDLELDPDDQSTPLPTKNRYTRSSGRFNQQLSDREPGTTSSRKRKRGQDPEIQVPDSSPVVSSPPPELTHSRSPALSEDLPEHPVAAVEAQADPQVYSDTMAPPMSSSSIMADDTHDVPPPAPQSARKQPGRGAAAKKADTNRMKAMTTVSLETFLPRAPRHRRAMPVPQRDGLDLPSSERTETPDRSSLTPEPKSRRRPKAKQNGKANGRGKASKSAVQTTPGRLSAPATSSPVSTRKAAKTLTSRTNKKARQTYGQRRNGENKENESDDEGSATETELVTPARRKARAKSHPLEDAQTSVELEAARRKFAEVDEWEMEFESVESGPTSSDWR